MNNVRQRKAETKVVLRVAILAVLAGVVLMVWWNELAPLVTTSSATTSSTTCHCDKVDGKQEQRSVGHKNSPNMIKLMEQWLRREGGGWSTSSSLQQQCDILPRRVDPGHWFSNIIPDAQPEFSLLSAWLKPEYPTALNVSGEIPDMYKEGFTMGGQIRVQGRYFSQVFLGSTSRTAEWPKEMIEGLILKAKEKNMKKYRDSPNIYNGIERYIENVRGLRGIVIGSAYPWVEAIVLSYGAARIVTLEFGSIHSTHPQIDTMVPGTFTEHFLNGQIEPFDFGISFSSLEHDGLGRYGDVLNPIGDLQSMAKLLTVIKPGGLFFVGVPTAPEDLLAFNAHRVYGPIRTPKFLAGWSYIDMIYSHPPNQGGYTQDLFVLQNLNGCSN
jgi:Caenorhabditis protein of unknown function, DUF268